MRWFLLASVALWLMLLWAAMAPAEAQRECGNGPCGYFGLPPPSNYAPAQRAVRDLKCEPWRSPETCPFKRTITRKR
jgi:hypothetical protein